MNPRQSTTPSTALVPTAPVTGNSLMDKFLLAVATLLKGAQDPKTLTGIGYERRSIRVGALVHVEGSVTSSSGANVPMHAPMGDTVISLHMTNGGTGTVLLPAGATEASLPGNCIFTAGYLATRRTQ